MEFFYNLRAQNNFADALATLASMIEILGEIYEIQITIQKHINLAFWLALEIEEEEFVDPNAWYYDIWNLLNKNKYPDNANKTSRVATHFNICAERLFLINHDGVRL